MIPDVVNDLLVILDDVGFQSGSSFPQLDNTKPGMCVFINAFVIIVFTPC